jgi:hypothetical protein
MPGDAGTGDDDIVIGGRSNRVRRAGNGDAAGALVMRNYKA